MKKGVKRYILLETEDILNNGRKNKIYKSIKKLYEEYKNDEYHDSITDKLYIDKLSLYIDKYYKRRNIMLNNVFIIIFSIVVIFAGYFISNYFNKINNKGNNIIEMEDSYLLIGYENLDDLMLTRERSTITINLSSKSDKDVIYNIYAVSDEKTNLNYEIISNNVTYGTNVLNSKRQLIYMGEIGPYEIKKINVDLWQNKFYNLNAQLRFYITSRIKK